MREINHHRLAGTMNDQIKVHAGDVRGPGGANIRYQISYVPESRHIAIWDLSFQHGDPASGINGITNEALLSVLIDRMEGFQSGPHKCLQNGTALANLRAALEVLQQRTRQRMAAGVEGTQGKSGRYDVKETDAGGFLIVDNISGVSLAHFGSCNANARELAEKFFAMLSGGESTENVGRAAGAAMREPPLCSLEMIVNDLRELVEFMRDIGVDDSTAWVLSLAADQIHQRLDNAYETLRREPAAAKS